MKRIKAFFENRDNIKNIILVVELILVIFLSIKCLKLEKKIKEYQDEENNMIVQKVQLPDIKEIEESYGETKVAPQSNTINNNTDVNNEMINYFDNTLKEIDNIKLKEQAKEKFVELVDFIFYDGSIKGHTFKELSNTTKAKIIKIFINIDNKIETKYPNYKETIKDTSNKAYNNIKTKIKELYLNIN